MKNEVYSGFKGMNRQADIANMSPDYLYDIYNGYVSKDTAIHKRFGYTKKFPVAIQGGSPPANADIIAYYEAIYDDGSGDTFACTSTKIYRWYGAGNQWLTLKTHNNAVNFVSITQYGDIVIFADGVNPPQKFNKVGGSISNLTMPSGVSSFKIVLIHNSRLWGITPENIVWFSALDNIENWTATGDDGAGYLNPLVYVTRGDDIETVASFSKAYLCFFCREHIISYSIGTVASEFQILQITLNTGTKSPNGVISFGNDLFYLDNDTAKSFIASDTSQELDLNDFTKGIMGNYYRDLIYPVANPRVCITKHTRRSWLLMHIPIGSAGEILIWDYVYKIWSGRWKLAHKVNYIFEDRDGNLCFASKGYIYKFDPSIFSDDGEVIEFHINTPYYYGKGNLNYERIPYIEFMSETDSVEVQLEVSIIFGYEDTPSTYEVVDIESGGSFWDEALWDEALWGASGESIRRVHSIGRGKMHRLVFRNAQLNKDVCIKLWKVFTKDLGNN